MGDGAIRLEREDRVMVLAPHPDDETLGAGGLLQQALAAGSSVRVVFVTDGENNPWPQRVLERRLRIGAEARACWGKRRRREALEALGCLGVPEDRVVFLGLPDQGLTRLLVAEPERALRELDREISEWRPTLLAGPSLRDRHPDHSALALLARFALERLAPQPTALRRVHYLIHAPRPSVCGEQLWLRLTPEQQYCKRRAILRHVSQLVFHRRSFLRFAAEEEVFVSDSSADDIRHPVRAVSFNGETVHLAIESDGRVWPVAPGIIYLLGRPSSSLKAELPAPPRRRVRVCEAASGSVVAGGRLSGNLRRADLALPRRALPDSQSVFVKLEHPFRFFDPDGWREIPLARRLL